MKIMKKIFLLLAVLLCSLALPTAAKADVTLDATNFPDANFRAYISTLTGVAQGGTITQSKINRVGNINCPFKKIHNFKGIEYFTSLATLWCYCNSLTTPLDLSKNTELSNVDCGACELTALDVTNNKKLTKLSCYSNKIPSIDLSQNTELATLAIGNNSLTALDVTHNKKLVSLSCYTNILTSLDVSQNSLLTYLSCYNQHLASLDVSNNKALEVLDINFCDLTSLDLSQNTELTSLVCDNDHLTSLDLSKNMKVTQFLEYNNKRGIKVYSYKRSAANGGGTGYYVPLTAQAAQVDGEKTYGPTESLAMLIDDSGLSGDLPFDITKVVSGTWGGATLSTLNGTQVLLLDATKKAITYQYNTDFTGKCTHWCAYASGDSTTVLAPNAYFTLTWSTNTSQVVTGVDGVENNDISVYTVNGAINVGGSFDGNVNVYNLRGQQVYCGTDSEIAVPAGVYIVKVNGKAHKVLVK
jgi:hypothetical protein